MTAQRLHHLREQALMLSARHKKKGWTRMNMLPRVTLNEAKWLEVHRPGIFRWVRTREYLHKTYLPDFDTPAPSAPKHVREIWVGARSLNCAGAMAEANVDGDDIPDGFRQIAEDSEDQAELTDLATFLYRDDALLEEWLERETAKRIAAERGTKWLNNRIVRRYYRKQLMLELPCDRAGNPVGAMIYDDETCELRPIRIGDCITIVRGSNDDLDALFLDEADDPRQQNDATAEGSDHRWSDRFRANNRLEEKFLESSCYTDPRNARVHLDDRWFYTGGIRPKSEKFVTPNFTDDMEEPHIPEPDDLSLRRQAQLVAMRLIEKVPGLSASILELTDEAERGLRQLYGRLKFNSEGRLDSGFFLSRDEFFGTLEGCKLSRKENTKQKSPPRAMDWEAVRASR